jgi:DNA-binding XRE family transcriptional regulator
MKDSLLKAKRKLLKMTQQEAAECLGISKQYYKQIENGHETPGLQLAIRIEKKFLIPCTNWEK